MFVGVYCVFIVCLLCVYCVCIVQKMRCIRSPDERWKNSVFVCVCVCLCMFVYVCVCLCMFVYICVYLCMFVYICVCCVCMYICMYVCMYMRIYVCVCVCVCMFVCICAHMCMCMCACVCVRVYVCIFIHHCLLESCPSSTRRFPCGRWCGEGVAGMEEEEQDGPHRHETGGAVGSLLTPASQACTFFHCQHVHWSWGWPRVLRGCSNVRLKLGNWFSSYCLVFHFT